MCHVRPPWCSCFCSLPSPYPLLERELLEEVLLSSDSLRVLGLALLGVALGEELLELLLGVSSAFGGEGSGVDQLLHVELHLVSGGHDVVQVDGLHEGLDGRSTSDLLLAHGSGDGSGVLSDARNDGVRELVLVGTLLEGLDDDGLFAGVLASQNDADSASFEDSHD